MTLLSPSETESWAPFELHVTPEPVGQMAVRRVAVCVQTCAYAGRRETRERMKAIAMVAMVVATRE